MNLYMLIYADRRYEIIATDYAQALQILHEAMPSLGPPLNSKYIPIHALDPRRVTFEWFLRQLGLEGPATFVQIGANDGVLDDPIYLYVRKYGWTGLAVEPLRRAYEALCQTYADIKGVRCERWAVGSGRPAVMYYVLPHDTTDRWVEGINSFSKAHIQAALVAVPQSYIIHEEVVETKPLMRGLEDAGFINPDILIIDTEGYDLEVLKQIDWDRLQPRLIVYEEKALRKSDQVEAIAMLTERGYVICRVEGDVYAGRMVPSREVLGHHV